jgi:HEAT repeat protein
MRASPHLRPRVISALGRIAHPTAIPALVPLLHARTGSTAYRALTALERIGLANAAHSGVQAAIHQALSPITTSPRVITRLSSYDITVGAYAAQIVRSLAEAHPD